MSNVSPFPDSKRPEAADANRQKIADAIKLLLSTLSPEEQASVIREIWPASALPAATRGGEVFGTVVRLLPRRAEWTVEDLKREVAAEGVKASAKEVYNALGYLTRKKRITRVAYGQYLIDGALFVTADDLGVPGLRDECGDY